MKDAWKRQRPFRNEVRTANRYRQSAVKQIRTREMGLFMRMRKQKNHPFLIAHQRKKHKLRLFSAGTVNKNISQNRPDREKVQQIDCC